MNFETNPNLDDFLDTDRIGYDLLNDPLLNKGTGFTDHERELLELHGLRPPTVATLDEQVSRRLQAFRQLSHDFQRYLFLRGLQDTNEVLFYALLVRHLEEMLPIVYTPTGPRMPILQPKFSQVSRSFSE